LTITKSDPGTDTLDLHDRLGDGIVAEQVPQTGNVTTVTHVYDDGPANRRILVNWKRMRMGLTGTTVTRDSTLAPHKFPVSIQGVAVQQSDGKSS